MPEVVSFAVKEALDGDRGVDGGAWGRTEAAMYIRYPEGDPYLWLHVSDKVVQNLFKACGDYLAKKAHA